MCVCVSRFRLTLTYIYKRRFFLSLYFNRGKWNDEDLQRAITAYKNGDMGLNMSSRMYGVPKATLKRHLDGTNKHAKGFKKLGRNTVLTEDTEKEMHALILKLESMFFGMPRKDLMSLAFEIANERGIDHPFNRDKSMAGKKWYYNFLKRHPDLSLRQPEATSISRASGFNKAAIDHYFNLLEELIDKHQLTADRIFNVDESGISTVQKRCQKVLGQKGKKQIGSLSSGVS